MQLSSLGFRFPARLIKAEWTQTIAVVAVSILIRYLLEMGRHLLALLLTCHGITPGRLPVRRGRRKQRLNLGPFAVGGRP